MQVKATHFGMEIFYPMQEIGKDYTPIKSIQREVKKIYELEDGSYIAEMNVGYKILTPEAFHELEKNLENELKIDPKEYIQSENSKGNKLW